MKKARIHISLDKPILDKLENRSKYQGITLSAYVNMHFKKHFRKNERIERGL